MKTYLVKYQIIAAVLVVSVPAPAIAQEAYYRFTGTVEGAQDSGQFGFSSPESPVPGLEVCVGDQINGTFKLDESPAETMGGISVSFESVVDFRVVLNGSELLPQEVPAGDRLWLNDEKGTVPQLLESTPLANIGDAQTITTPLGGVALSVEGKESVQIALVLNFTETTGSLFDNESLPESIALDDYDVAKGFIRTFDIERPRNTATHGIMFNIDSIEEYDPSAPEPVELATGYHVSWPADAEGFVLEEAESLEGPWKTSEVMPIVVNGLNVVLMDMRSRLRVYRLVRAN